MDIKGIINIDMFVEHPVISVIRTYERKYNKELEGCGDALFHFLYNKEEKECEIYIVSHKEDICDRIGSISDVELDEIIKIMEAATKELIWIYLMIL